MWNSTALSHGSNHCEPNTSGTSEAHSKAKRTLKQTLQTQTHLERNHHKWDICQTNPHHFFFGDW